MLQVINHIPKTKLTLVDTRLKGNEASLLCMREIENQNLVIQKKK